jgi:hypothetical protein
MEILYTVFPFFYTGMVLLLMYSIIRWIAVVIADRKALDRRKKYARLCLFCMIVIALMGFLSFVISFNHNRM